MLQLDVLLLHAYNQFRNARLGTCARLYKVATAYHRRIKMADDPVCSRCKTTSSLMWHKNKEGEILCLACNSEPKASPSTISERQQQQPQQQATATPTSGPGNHTATAAPSTNTGPGRRTRLRNAKGRYGKAAERAKGPSPSQHHHQDAHTGSSSGVASQRKGGGATTTGRRSLLKGRPTKAPRFAPSIVTSDRILHKVSHHLNSLILYSQLT